MTTVEGAASFSDAEKCIVELNKALRLTSKSRSRAAMLIESISSKDSNVLIKLRPIASTGRATEILLPLCELRAHSATEEELASYAFGKILKDLCDIEFEPSAFFCRSLQPILSREGETKDTISSPYASEIVAHASAGRDVLVLGRSAAGKTLASLQAALSLQRRGISVEWLDLSEPDRTVWDAVASVARSRADVPLVLILDDAQSNPAEIGRIAQLHKLLSPTQHLKFSVVILAWASARQSLEVLWTNAVQVAVSANKVMREVLASGLPNFSDFDRQQLENFISGDLVATTIAMRFMRRQGRFPTADELASEAFSGIIGEKNIEEAAAEILFRTAALSQFEIDVSHAHLEQISSEAVGDLVKRRILKRNGPYLSIGHRSSARLLLRALASKFPTLMGRLPDPGRLAVAYLRTTDTAQLVTTLERLDIARLQGRQFDQHGTRFLVRLWDSLQLLLKALDKAGTADPTWRDDTGSGAMASRILVEFDLPSSENAIKHQRSRWQIVKDESAPVPSDPAPNERKDFDEIRRCMIEEEETCNLPKYAEPVASIDFDRMHRTWVLGFLLGTEAAAAGRPNNRLHDLKALAESIQLVGGAFYPHRVPWVTARVLIGLAQAGESVESSSVVRDACNWLLQESPEGPCSFGAWQPNTGVWNSVLGTTAMCINALVRSGVRSDHPTIDLAVNYLADGRAGWSQIGEEIDCAFALETFLLTGAPWRDFSFELTQLIDWARDPAIWETVVLDATRAKDESLKIPLIASSLVGIIWSIVRAELPLLLEDLATGALLPDGLSYSTFTQEVRSIARRLDELKSYIRINIEQRLTLLSTSNVAGEQLKAKLAEFRDLAKRCEELVEHATRMPQQSSRRSYSVALENLRNEANRLGKDCLRDAWEPIEHR